MTDPAAVVFVHGAWHGPWCWNDWAEAAEARGHEAVVLTLPGHDRPGSPQRIWTRMGQMIAAVERTLATRTGPTVVVGHSMGGYIVQRALEGQPFSVVGAALIAPVPRRGVAATTIRMLRRSPQTALRGILTADLYRAVGTHDLCRAAFFSPETPEAIVGAALGRLQNESSLTFPPMLARWSRPDRIDVPVLVVAPEQDGLFSVDQQRDLAAAHGVDPVVVAGAGHDLMLEPRGAEAASVVLGWANDRFAEATA